MPLVGRKTSCVGGARLLGAIALLAGCADPSSGELGVLRFEGVDLDGHVVPLASLELRPGREVLLFVTPLREGDWIDALPTTDPSVAEILGVDHLVECEGYPELLRAPPDPGAECVLAAPVEATLQTVRPGDVTVSGVDPDGRRLDRIRLRVVE